MPLIVEYIGFSLIGRQRFTQNHDRMFSSIEKQFICAWKNEKTEVGVRIKLADKRKHSCKYLTISMRKKLHLEGTIVVFL